MGPSYFYIYLTELSKTEQISSCRAGANSCDLSISTSINQFQLLSLKPVHMHSIILHKMIANATGVINNQLNWLQYGRLWSLLVVTDVRTCVNLNITNGHMDQ